MGMYTQLYLGVRLDKDMPKEIVDFLQWVQEGKIESPPTGEHAFFKTERFHMFGRGASAYFDAMPVYFFEYSDNMKSYYLTTCFSIKNYSQEHQKFLDMINPYIHAGKGYKSHIGHIHYEEDDEPTLLFREDGSIV